MCRLLCDFTRCHWVRCCGTGLEVAQSKGKGADGWTRPEAREVLRLNPLISCEDVLLVSWVVWTKLAGCSRLSSSCWVPGKVLPWFATQSKRLGHVRVADSGI